MTFEKGQELVVSQEIEDYLESVQAYRLYKGDKCLFDSEIEMQGVWIAPELDEILIFIPLYLVPTLIS